MVYDVILPKLGLTMSMGTIVKWHKDVGEEVASGDALFDFETDKAQSTVNSEVSGALIERLFDEGDEVDVLAVVCRVGEPISNESPSGRIRATPMARKLAAQYGMELNAVQPARGDRIEQADVEAAWAAMSASDANGALTDAQPATEPSPADSEPLIADSGSLIADSEPLIAAQGLPQNAWIVDVDMERMLALCGILERSGEKRPMDRLLRHAVSLTSAQCDARVVLCGTGGSADLRIACSSTGEWVLSMGRIAERPMVKDGLVVAAATLRLALSCGAFGTCENEVDVFLSRLKSYLETPELFMAQLRRAGE